MKAREAVVLRIKELIQLKEMNINSLSMLSAVPPSTLKNIICGKSQNPGIVTIVKICDGLGVSIKEFFTADIFENLEQEIE